MRLLLDTHIAIWALLDDARLSRPARDLITSSANSVFVSAVSVWEIAIKHSLGKASRPPFSGIEALRYFREAGYLLLDVTAEHAANVETLVPLHQDPFDRLLVAQAVTEPLHLLTHDEKLSAYSEMVTLV